MAKISIGSYVLEGTIDELKQMGVKFPVEEEPEPLKVGDYAKVVAEECNGYSENGDIVIINEVDNSDVPFSTEHLNGEYSGWHYTTDLVRATDEEVAEAKRKLVAETERKQTEAKWAKIGRKPGEFKLGDIVEVIDSPSALPNGSLFEIRKMKGKTVCDNSEFQFEYMIPTWQLKLIAPVEAKFE